MEVLTIVGLLQLIRLSALAPQGTHTQPSYKWAYAHSYSWTYSPPVPYNNDGQQPVPVALRSFSQQYPFYQSPQTIRSQQPFVNEPQRVNTFDSNRGHPTRNLGNATTISAASNVRGIQPVVNEQQTFNQLPIDRNQNLNTRSSSDIVEADLQAIVQRVIAEIGPNLYVRQATSYQDLERMVRMIIAEQQRHHRPQSASDRQIPPSSPTNNFNYNAPVYPSNGLNSHASQHLPVRECFHNCNLGAPVVAIAMANAIQLPSNMHLNIRQLINAMTYTSA